LVTPFDEAAIWMSDHELEMGKEIEEKIVNELTRRHIAINAGSMEVQPQTPVGNVTFSPQPPQQFANTQTIIPSSLTNNVVSTTMPGLAPINVYQNQNPVSVKAATMPNVLLQLKGDGEYTTELLPTTMLKRSVSAKEDRCTLTFEMQEFIREFKKRRINLGYTQDDVGRELSALNGPTYSQSFISRFEGKQLGMKAAERMRPILENWIHSKEEEHNNRNKFAKKRRKRTSFPPEILDILNELFRKNPKPTFEEMAEIAQKINRDVTTVKVWFCNKKQSLKRLGHPILNSMRSPLRAEMLDIKHKRKSEADVSDMFQINQGAIKTLVPVSSGGGGMPFFISQDGNSITIMSGAHATTVPTASAVGNPHSSSMPQQIVHLSQLPMLTNMAVMNNMNGAQTPDGTNAHVLSNGRVLPNGAVIQLTGNPLSAQQQQIQQNINNGNPSAMSDGTVIIAPSDPLHDQQVINNNQENNNEQNRLQLLNNSNDTPLNSEIMSSQVSEEEEEHSDEESSSSSMGEVNDNSRDEKDNENNKTKNLLMRGGVIERNVMSVGTKLED